MEQPDRYRPMYSQVQLTGDSQPRATILLALFNFLLETAKNCENGSVSPKQCSFLFDHRSKKLTIIIAYNRRRLLLYTGFSKANQ